MAQQTGSNVVIGYKVEGTFDTAPGATGAEQLRLTNSPGMAMARALIESQEVKSDLQTAMARLGSRSVPGTFNGELSEASWDTILEALMRSTWVAAVAITEVEMTSITTTTSTIVAAAGSWITEGVRVGDVVVLTGHATAANNDINLRVASVSALTITVIGTPLTLDATPDTAFTLTVLKKLKNGTSATRRSFYIDQYYSDLDLSAVFGGCRFTSLGITGAPDGMANISVGVLGASQAALASGASPYYTTPTQYATDSLTFVDAVIARGGTDIANLTAFELNLAIAAETLPIIGGVASPDVFDNEMRVTGTMSGLRADLTQLTNFGAETEFELHILLEETGAAPKGCISLFVPRVKLTSVDAPLGQAGAMVESLAFTTGPKPATTGYDESTLTICTTAA